MNKVISTLVLVMSCIVSVWGQAAPEDTAQKVTLANLLENGSQYVGKTVSFSGKTIHVCSKSGMKLFMEIPGTKQTLRVNSTPKLGKFPRTCNNHKVEIIGIVEESRIDEDFLKQWESKIKAQTEEKHGHGEEGCAAEKAATKETGNSSSQRIADFRKRIAQRKQAEGKNYLSFYHVKAISYHIVQ